MSNQGLYQQLRGHLAYLNLREAAAALPGEFDNATKDKLGHTAFLERLLARSRPPRSAGSRVGSASPHCRHPGGWRTSTSTPNLHRPQARAGAGHPPHRRRGRQRAPGLPARSR
jgi:hypothetical protein